MSASPKALTGNPHAERAPQVAPPTAPIDSDLLALFDSAPVGIHLVDANGFIKWANRTELEMLGYERDEYIGHHIAEFHVDKDVIDDILCTLKSGATLAFKEARLRHRDGSVRIGSINSNVLWENGKFIHTRCFTRDVTELQALEIKQAQADAQVVESARITEALYRLTDNLQRAKTPNEIYDSALLAIQKALRCDRAAILLFDQAGSMRFVGSQGLSESYRSVVEGHSPWTIDAIDPQPIGIDDVESAALDPSLQKSVLREGIRALAFIPLLVDGGLIGKFMAYFDAPHVFDADDFDLCLAIARQLSFGIEHHLAEEALRDNERRFREILDALPAAIYRTDAAGRITYFNPAAIEFSGTVPELGSDHWCVGWELFRPDGGILPYDQCPMAVTLKEGHAVRDAEVIIERPDGSRRWFTPFPTLFKDYNGRVVGAINMLLDITDRKEAEQALLRQARQLVLITDIAPVYIAYCDANGRYKFVNKPYAARLGLSPEKMIGQRVADFLGQDTYAQIAPHISAVLKGERVEFDLELRHADQKRVMHCSYAPEYGQDGKIIGWVATSTDITDRKQVEEALRASEELLRETDRRKDEFLAMLSHELRNPLAPIANAVHLLRRDPTQSPLFQQARAIIERQTGRLARLVDDLLEVSRITTGRIQLQLERIAISGIVERALETVRPLIEQRKHTLNVSVPREAIWVDADSARLEQVLVNLLTNAAKYTDDGGCIELTAAAIERRVVLAVKDTGIGISPELLPRIFELFTQAERAIDRSQGGLGIGLALVERLVSMHGGIVEVDSKLDKGSQFTVTLPLAMERMSNVVAAEPRTDAEAQCSLRVLVVDDNNDAASSLAMLIESVGHSVATADDGLRALDAVAEFQPHIVFLDLGLPKLDGYAVARRLRESNKDIVLVALTGYGRETDRDRTLQAGFNHHLVKPVEFSVVEEVLGKSSSALH